MVTGFGLSVVGKFDQHRYMSAVAVDIQMPEAQKEAGKG